MEEFGKKTSLPEAQLDACGFPVLIEAKGADNSSFTYNYDSNFLEFSFCDVLYYLLKIKTDNFLILNPTLRLIYCLKFQTIIVNNL